MSYTPGAALKPGLAPGRDCAVRIDRVIDERTNKKVLGHFKLSERNGLGLDPTFPLIIHGENTEDWVHRIFNDLRVLGYTVVEADTAGNTPVRMSVHLTQINVQFVNQLIVSTSRMTVRYTKKDGSQTAMNYRGRNTKTNWIGNPGEIMASLNHAVIGAMHDVAQDLVKLCDS